MAVGEKPVDKDLPCAGDVDPLEGLAQRADEHGVPEAIDGRLGLSMADQPGGKVFVVRGASSLAWAVAQPPHTAADRQQVMQGQITRAGKRRRQMQRSGQSPAANRLTTRSRPMKESRAPSEKIGEPDRAAKVLKIGATAQADVLAIVDLRARRLVDERAGPATQAGGATRTPSRSLRVRRAHGGRQAGQTAAHNHGGAARRTRGGPSRSSGRHQNRLGERRLCHGNAIDERRQKPGASMWISSSAANFQSRVPKLSRLVPKKCRCTSPGRRCCGYLK